MVNNRSDDLNTITDLLERWFVGTVFWGFSFADGFRLLADRGELTRSEAGGLIGRDVPTRLVLDLKCHWWIGSREEWVARAHQSGCLGSRGQDFEPYMACQLRKMMYSSVISANLANDGQLSFRTSYGDDVFVPGTSNISDYYSWSLFAPEDDPEFAGWSITADTQGKLLAAWG